MRALKVDDSGTANHFGFRRSESVLVRIWYFTAEYSFNHLLALEESMSCTLY